MSKDIFDEVLQDEFGQSDSDDEQRRRTFVRICAEYQNFNNEESTHGGSSSRRRRINRDRASGNRQLFNDYFSENSVYPDNLFRRRFRMHRTLFLRILNDIRNYDNYFVQRMDALGIPGCSGLQKMTASLRMLAYGVGADAIDEYIRMGETTITESLQRFCYAIIAVYGSHYLRYPNEADIARLLRKGEEREFPGMLGSLDCMHWVWKNCPTAWHGAYTGHIHKPSIVLEAVASHDLWIWHAFFGMPGSHNDINVLDHSPLFSGITEGRAPPANFTINNHQYNMGYYLADGIYPKWATIVQSISHAPEENKRKFNGMQEAYRKDVERAFGVLQARFAIVRGPARSWSRDDLHNIMKTCIILHNMIIEDERDKSLDYEYDIPAHIAESSSEISREMTPQFNEFMARHHMLRSSRMHHMLRNDLIEHVWARRGRGSYN